MSPPKKLLMRRRLVASLVFLLAVALCAGLVWFNFFRDRMIGEFFANMKPPAQTVSAGEVVRKLWKPGVNAIGTARAANGVELAVQIAGVVKEIRFRANQRVEAGELLVQLDDSLEKADLIDVQAAVRLNETTVERTANLRSRGYDTQSAYDQAVAALATARSKLARTQATIELKALKAPFAGEIGIPRINPGQYLQPGDVVASLQDLRIMKVDFTVPEQIAPRIKIGQPARFGSTEGDLPFPGEVIGTDPRIDPATRLVAMQARMDRNDEGKVQPGQFLRVRIDLPPEPDVVTVPQTAVSTSLYGDYVYTVEEDRSQNEPRLVVKQVFVKVGRREGMDAEILSGVEPGQRVVTSGQNKLQAGSVVKIDNSIDLSRVAGARE
jgi:membrane fusion protein (multidrug efflux system)